MTKLICILIFIITLPIMWFPIVFIWGNYGRSGYWYPDLSQAPKWYQLIINKCIE